MSPEHAQGRRQDTLEGPARTARGEPRAPGGAESCSSDVRHEAGEPAATTSSQHCTKSRPGQSDSNKG